MQFSSGMYRALCKQKTLTSMYSSHSQEIPLRKTFVRDRQIRWPNGLSSGAGTRYYGVAQVVMILVQSEQKAAISPETYVDQVISVANEQVAQNAGLIEVSQADHVLHAMD